MNGNGARIHWIDCMRGFSMVMVVMGHIMLDMGLGSYNSLLNFILLTFRMPLFFFVSGFFSFRTTEWWTRERASDIMARKFKAQILCAVVFALISNFTFGSNIMSPGTGFGIYWFTIVLFQMYAVYLLLSLASRLTDRDITVPSMIVLSLALVLTIGFYRGNSFAWNYFCWENLTKYFQFFTLGIICAKYRTRFFATLGANWLITASITGWTACMMLCYVPSFAANGGILYHFIHDIAVRYFSLATVVVIFYKNARVFGSETRMGKIMGLVGRRTLDIYMIHYFFLPDISVLTPFLQSGNMIIFQLAVSLSLAIAITAVSLGISSILRESRTLRKWLFGAKVTRGY